jgi:uncharacterized membrane protein
MKKSFITGLIILLPLFITFLILRFIINFLTTPFIGLVQSSVEKLDIFKNGFLIFSRSEVILYTSQALTLVILFLLLVILGFLARWFVFHYFFRLSDTIFHRIPFLNKIYMATQEVLNNVFSQETSTFRQVVIVPFPHSKGLCIGFITNEEESFKTEQEIEGRVTVFIPGTPNPTVGFLLMYQKKQLTYIDLKVEDAMKWVVSCGVMTQKFTQKQ